MGMIITVGPISSVLPCGAAAIVGAPYATQTEVVQSTTSQDVQINTATKAFARALAFGALRARLDRWVMLDDDWDGAGGVAPARRVVEAARRFLADAERAGVALPEIYIAGDGEVGFRWDRPTAFASVSFLDDDHIVAFARSEGSDPLKIDQPVKSANLGPLFTRLRATV